MSDPSLSNPYRAPLSPPESPPAGGIRPATDGDEIKWIYLLTALSIAVAVMTLPSRAAVAITGTGNLVTVALGLWWLRTTWAAIPPFDKAGDNAGHVSPSGVVWRFFVPLYVLYWAFAANVALCRMMNRSLERMRMPTRAYPALAVVAMIVNLSFLVQGPAKAVASGWVILKWIESALWFGYMVHVDVARRIMILASRVEATQVDGERG